ncbi:MAG: Na+/H+ antiporter NhaC family protein [Pseudomonadota bacterium]
MTTDAQDAPRGGDISLLLALLPALLLLGLLTWNVFIYGDDALSGSSQLSILAVAGLTSAIAVWLGVDWETQLEQVTKSISTTVPALLILLLVGSLASIWLLCGTVPTLVYYGLMLLSPAIFLFASTILCAVTALVSGSSWSTSATIGVALIGIGRALELPDGLIAGAVISGAYFGDKVSPLSDTTNLAAAATGTNVFDHIRYLFLTTGPSMLLSALVFLFIGLGLDGATPASVADTMAQIDATFNVSGWLLLPPLLVLVLIVRGAAAVPAMVAGIVAGVFAAGIWQQDLIGRLLEAGLAGGVYELLMTTLFAGLSIPVDDPMLAELFGASGMAGMLNTTWLIIAAMTFGGIYEASGLLDRIMSAVRSVVNGFFSLVACTGATCLVTNVSTSDQYMAVAVPGRMFSSLYRDMGYDSRNLSRTLEDTGTVTSVLVPWNTCGAYHASVLGVATLTYLPYCFFNLISPLMTLLFAALMIRIRRLPEPSAAQAA